MRCRPGGAGMALSCEESDDRARCRRRAGFEAGACEHWRRVGGSAVRVLASVAQARRGNVRRRPGRAGSRCRRAGGPPDRRCGARRRPDRRRDRRRQLFPGRTAAAARYGAHQVGLYGNARHCHEQPCTARLPGEGRHRYPSPDRDHHGPFSRWPNRTCRCGPSATWRRDGW